MKRTLTTILMVAGMTASTGCIQKSNYYIYPNYFSNVDVRKVDATEVKTKETEMEIKEVKIDNIKTKIEEIKTKQTETETEIDEETWKDKLEDIKESVVCLRKIVVYEGEKEKFLPIERRLEEFWGTGFSYKMDEEKNFYIATNHHVANAKENEISVRNGKKLSKKDTLLFIIENKSAGQEDPIPLEMVEGKNDPTDTYVLRTKEEMYISDAYEIDPDIEIQMGDEVHLLGCRSETIVGLTSGQVSNTDYGNDELLLNLTTTPGSSGGPVFLRRDNDLYLIGQISGHRNIKGGENLGIATKFENLEPYWKLGVKK